MTDEPVTVPDGFRLTPGRARVNVIDVLLDEPNFLVVEIDMRSKYIEPIIAFGDADSDGSEIWFWPGDRGLHLDESTDKATMLLLPERTAGWDVIADSGRYTIRIAAWKRPEAQE